MRFFSLLVGLQVAVLVSMMVPTEASVVQGLVHMIDEDGSTLGEATAAGASYSGPNRIQPASKYSVHERDALLLGKPNRRGIDGGRARPSGEMRKMWKEREDLIDILRAIAGASRRTQSAKNREYKATEAKLRALEVKMGFPYSHRIDAKDRMKLLRGMRGEAYASYHGEYNVAQKDYNQAILKGRAVASGEFKKFILNDGASMEQKLRDHNQKVLIDAENSMRKTEDTQEMKNQKDRYARHDYEASWGRRPGCAYIDGPCDHSEKDVPGKPLESTSNYVKPFSVTLTWMVPRLNRSFIIGYRIMARKEGETTWRKVGEAKKGMAHIMKKVRNLEAGVKYVMRIQALYVPAKIRKMNVRELSRELQLHGKASYTAAAQGDKNVLMARYTRIVGEAAGPPSDDLKVSTPQTVPSKMEKPIISAMAYTHHASINFTLSWKAPNANGSPVSGYRIFKTMNGDMWGWEEVIKNTGSNATTLTMTGFKSGGHQYQFKIKAINHNGESHSSEPSNGVASLEAKPAAAVPAPQVHGVFCKNADCGFRLTWQTPISNGAKVTGYRISYQTDGTGPFKIKVRNTYKTKTSQVIRGLKGGRNYAFRVMGWNKEGWGVVDSPQVLFKTPAGVPSAPKKPVWGDVLGTSLKLSWNKPANNGATITGYRITYQEGGTGGFFEKIKNTNSPALAIVLTGLKTGGVAYNFKVQAYNSVGIGPYSKASDAVQTKYSSSYATTKATRLQYEQFKATHKVYTIRQLDMYRKLYKTRYLKTLKRFRVAKERGQKAETQVAQLQQSANVQSALNSKKLALERDIAYKKVILTDKMDTKKKRVMQKLSQKKIDHSYVLSSERLAIQRKHFEKLLKKKNDVEEELRDKIWLLNKKVQKETQLRLATEAKARASAAPQRTLRESSGNKGSHLQKMFKAAENDAAADTELTAELHEHKALAELSKRGKKVMAVVNVRDGYPPKSSKQFVKSEVYNAAVLVPSESE